MAPGKGLRVDAQIELVERRIEARRGRMVSDLAEARDDARRLAAKATRVLPLVGTAAALVAGFFLARRRHAMRTSVPPAVVPRFVPAAAPIASSTAKGVLGTLVALAAGAVRLATSAEGRMLWQAFRTARERGRRGPAARDDGWR